MNDWLEFVKMDGSKVSLRPYLINLIQEDIKFGSEMDLTGEVVGTIIYVDDGNSSTPLHLQEKYEDVKNKIIEAEKLDYCVNVKEDK